MRSLYILIIFVMFIISGCGGGGSSSSTDQPGDGDTPAGTDTPASTATYSGGKVAVTTNSMGKAVVTSSTLGVAYNIFTVDSSGDPVTGITVVYSENDGKSVIYIKDSSRVYSDVILIGTPLELSSAVPRSAKSTDLYVLGVKLKAAEDSSVGFTSSAYNTSKIYVTESDAIGSGWDSGCYRLADIVSELSGMDSSKDVVMTFEGDVADSSLKYLTLDGSWLTDGGLSSALGARLQSVFGISSSAAADDFFMLTCYRPSSGALYDNGIGAVCRIEKSDTKCSYVLTKTGQNTCYDASGSSIPCDGTGQDGEYQAGVAASFTRTTSFGEIVTDNVNGMIWEDSGAYSTPRYEWLELYTESASLNYNQHGGYSDWRTPNMKELFSLVNFASGSGNDYSEFLYFPAGQAIWTSEYRIGGIDAWYVYFTDIGVYAENKNMTLYSAFVAGKTEPDISFSRSGTYGIVTDNITGLMWEDDAVGSSVTWVNALSRCESLSLGGYDDWRLPNIRELMSIMELNGSSSVNAVFTNYTADDYWSSTTSVSVMNQAYAVFFYTSPIMVGEVKSASAYVRCVR
ncbi:MAG: DUF1566 domain-containing protein [Deferribacterales bacterium]